MGKKKKKIDPIKKQLVRASSSEDQVLSDMSTNFPLDEITQAYEKGIVAVDDHLTKNEAIIARSLLAMGMGQYLRCVAAKLKEEKK